jgi:stage III sporulation protein AB
MKWAGACLIILASFLIGRRKSKAYTNRMQSAILFGSDSIETTTRFIAETSEKPASLFFHDFAEQLSSTETSATHIWTHTLQRYNALFAFKTSDIRLIEQAGHMLGSCTQEAEERRIKHVLKQLEKRREEAVAEEQRLAGMVRAVSVLSGLLTAILLM